MAKRKTTRAPVRPAASTETGRLRLVMEALQTQFQHFGEGLTIANRRLEILEQRSQDVPHRLESLEVAVRHGSGRIDSLEAAVRENSTDIRRLDARLSLVEATVERMNQKLDRKVDRDEFAALAGRVSTLEHG